MWIPGLNTPRVGPWAPGRAALRGGPFAPEGDGATDAQPGHAPDAFRRTLSAAQDEDYEGELTART